MTADITLRVAETADIAFIMSAERGPGYERYIGQWGAERHAGVMADRSNWYLLGLDASGVPAGFAMLRELDHPFSNVYLQRIAVAKAGHGIGRALLARVTDWVFRETAAHRFWLHMAADNVTAERVYRSAGFVHEGSMREFAPRPDGSRFDAMIFSKLRAEWSQPFASATT